MSKGAPAAGLNCSICFSANPDPSPSCPPPTALCRARIHALEKQLAKMAPEGLVEFNAGVRSCMIEYDLRRITLPALLDAIAEADAAIGNVKARRGATPSHTLLP